MKDKSQEVRPKEVKDKKSAIRSVQESISNVESLLALARSQKSSDPVISSQNDRAILSAQNVLLGLKAKLKTLKDS